MSESRQAILGQIRAAFGRGPLSADAAAALDAAARLVAWQDLQNHLLAWQQAAEGLKKSLLTP